MGPAQISNLANEALPKRVPADGCGFSGIPGDFPPEKAAWYTAEGEAKAAGASLRRGGSTGALRSSHGGPKPRHKTQENMQTPSCVGTATPARSSSRSGCGASKTLRRTRSTPSLCRSPSGTCPTQEKEISHQALHYGQCRLPGEMLFAAGAPTFRLKNRAR